MPIRIQRKRTKGWTMPANTVYVGRPSRWGNKFQVGHHYKRGGYAIPRMGIQAIYMEAFEGHQDSTYTTLTTIQECVDWHRWYTTKWGDRTTEELRGQLRGKNLACFCPLDQPCHADVLLELANGPEATR